MSYASRELPSARRPGERRDPYTTGLSGLRKARRQLRYNETTRRTGSPLSRGTTAVWTGRNHAELLRPRIFLPPADRQRAVSVAGDHAGRDPRLRRRDRHGVAAARGRRRQDRRCVLVADPRARRHGAAEHRRLPQRARGGDHGKAGARIVRHLLDQARGDRRQRHAAARRGRPGRSRRHPDQGRL